MNILKRRVNGTSIVLVGEKMYTRTEVTDELWIAILEQIDKVNESCEDSDKLAVQMDYLMDLIDPDRVAKQEKVAEMVFIAIQSGNLEPDKDTRIRKAKRVADISGIFESDDNGIVYLKGFKHSMPKIMIDAILDAHYNPSSEYTVSSLINFWKYLLLNPDKHVREGLFQWIKTGQFAITEDGNIISYRNVDVKVNGSNSKLIDFVGESWSKVKRWKKSPNNYKVFKDTDGSFGICGLDSYNEDYIYLGRLSDLMDMLVYTDGTTIYEPQHKGPYGQVIKLGEAVSMPRSECDNDPNSSCSRGLHCKSVSYGLNMGNTVLVTLTNPYNIVAIPSSDHSKFRSCEYYPLSKAELDDKGNLVEFKGGTYDIPYNGLESLNNLLKFSTVDSLIEEGLISEEINISDMESIIKEATEVISKRITKLN